MQRRPRSGYGRTSWLAALAIGAGISIASATAADGPATIAVHVDKPGTAIPPDFMGFMTEEINHAYDGGLYAELIQNRTFQDPGNAPGGLPVHWSVVGQGKASTDAIEPVNSALPVSLRLDLSGGEAGVSNDGYWGVPVRPDTPYSATFYARGSSGFAGPVTVSLLTDDGKTVASAQSQPVTGDWRKHTIALKTGPDAPTTAKARFVLSAKGSGRVSFSYVSLFPPTYQNAPNGLRPDLMKLMAEMRPKFIRLPGGNYLEGGRFADRFRWKEMVGPPDQRPGHMGCWGYRSSDGFGLPEFLLWCKQLGAEPVLGVFAGYVLNGDYVKAGTPEMDVFTQEALEEIEYVMGPADSQWGARRAADGFPEPFALKYVEIGNEDWFDKSGSYDGRFTQIARAIRARYPQLKLIASAPVTSFKPDLYDDHFYRSARQLMGMATMYDPTTADSPKLSFAGGGFNGRQRDTAIKTFVGEWATQEGRPTPTLNAGLADAAFIMGMEKNSDAVVMECYAPLLVNVNPADPAKGYPKGWQWNTNLIGYDALHSFGSPSYHAQVMLAQNKGDVVLPTEFTAPTSSPSAETPRGGIGLGSWHTDVEYTDLSVTAPDGRVLMAPDQTGEWRSSGGPWNARGRVVAPARKDAETWAFTGDPGWTDYTIRVKARKNAGREGFIVIWHAVGEDEYRWWNIGGWGNTEARCEAANSLGGRDPYGPSAPFRVEAGRWYDLRLEVAGRRVRGYIDDKLVTDVTSEPRAASIAAFTTATYDKADRTVIVKFVNAGASPLDARVELRGVSRVEPEGTALVISGEPGAVNSVDEPLKVAPRREAVSGASTSFVRTFPAHSLTVLRLKATAP